MTDRPPLLPWYAPARWGATLGVGHSPFAPGTLGAALALAPGYLLLEMAGPLGLLAATAGLFALGVPAAARYGRASGRVDDPHIVIDEAVGQWLALLALPLRPAEMPAAHALAAAFVLFRLFDIAKPWPIRLIDRRTTTAWGVMIDDVAAGLCAGAVAAGLFLLQ